MNNQSDNDSMVLVDSSDEEDFFSDASCNTAWIFPMAKPPSDAGFDTSFIQLVQDAMDKIHPPQGTMLTSEESGVEYGRRDDIRGSSMDELPLLLQEADHMSLPDVKGGSTVSDDIRLPPWLCLDNDKDVNQFKDQMDEFSRKQKVKTELSLAYNQMSTPHYDIPSVSFGYLTNPREEKTPSFLDRIEKTSTPISSAKKRKPMTASSSRIPTPTRKLNHHNEKNKLKSDSKPSSALLLPTSKLPISVAKHRKRENDFQLKAHLGLNSNETASFFQDDNEQVEQRRIAMFGKIPTYKRRRVFNLQR